MSSSCTGLRALVAVKRVIDYATRIRVRKDGRWVETDGVKHSMNPFDENAIEAALCLREQGFLKSITVVSCGSEKNVDVIRTALAMGVDKGIHVDVTDGNSFPENEGLVQPLQVAKIIKAIAIKENVDLIIMGKQAIDDDSNQTGQMVAGLLNWPQATFVSHIQVNGDVSRKTLKVTREVDEGIQVISVQLPTVITTDLRLNEPRYASLQNIMKAKHKPLEKESAMSLNVDISPRLEIVTVVEPTKKNAGKMVHSVDQLIESLKKSQVL